MIQGLDDDPGPARPRSPLVHTASHRPPQLDSSKSQSPPLPLRSPLRPPTSPLAATKDAPAQDMPSPLLRMSSSSSFSVDTLIPTKTLIIDGPFLNDKSRSHPLLSLPRTPSPDKPLPITPLSPSSTTLNDVRGPDSPRVRYPLDSPPSSATLPSKGTANGISKRTHALVELIESERAYASDLALIRDIHLPVALGKCIIFPHIHVISDDYFPLKAMNPQFQLPLNRPHHLSELFPRPRVRPPPYLAHL